MTRRRYIYHISIAAYQKAWEGQYRRPGFGARLLAFLFRLIPKVGPLRAFAFRTPPPAAEKLFLASFDGTEREYQQLLVQASANNLQLPDENFDTGRPTRLGEYHLADETYSKLLERLDGHIGDVSTSLRANVLAFYGASAGPASKKAADVLAAFRASAAAKGLTDAAAGAVLPLQR